MIQKLYCIISKPICFVSNHIAEKIKKPLLTMICFMMVLFDCCTKLVGGPSIRESLMTLVMCVFVLLIIICIIPPEVKVVKYNIPLSILWIVMNVVMFISAFFTKIDYILIPFWLACVFPYVWFVIKNSNEYEILLESVSKAYVFTFPIFFVMCILFVPQTIYSFAGIFANTSSTSQYLSIVAISALYLIFAKKRYAYSAVFGLTAMMMYLTRSRTGLISIILCFVIAVVFAFFKKKIEKKYVIRLCIHLVMTTVAFIGGLFLYTQINNVCQKSIQQHFSINAYKEIMEQKQQVISDVVVTQVEEVAQLVDARVNISEKNEKAATLDRYSSGRFSIWRIYLENTSFWGHKDIIKGQSTAHNVVLQILYDNGIIPAVVCLILIIVMIFKSIAHFFKNHSVTDFWSILVVMVFVVTALLGSIVAPYKYLLTFWTLVTVPIWNERLKEKSKK